MNPVLTFLSRHHKPILVAIAALAIAAGSFALGRFGTAERVVVKEVVKEVEKEVVVEVEVEKIVEKRVVVADTSAKIRRTEVQKPDGTVIKTEDVNVDSTTNTTDDKATERVEVVEKIVEKIVEKRVDVIREKPMPDWRAGLMVGANAPELPGLVSGAPFDPLKQLAAGALVERRIVGPLSLGAWGTTTGSVGILATLEF